jgi:hypothetical protein
VRALALLLFFQLTAPTPVSPTPRVVELSRTSTEALPERVLDLAFVNGSSLLVLSAEALALYRLDGAEMKLLDREPLPGPLRPVRAPGGLLLLADGEAFCWALTSGTPRATLFAVSPRGIDLQSDAEAVPWPGIERGVRFRAGTNLLEAALPGAEGPYLRVLGGDGALAVATRGELLDNGRTSALRVGPALAPLWPGRVAAASSNPPGPSDEVLLVGRTTERPEVVSRHEVPGAVRALATRVEGRKATLAAALEAPEGVFRIVLLELAEAEP